MTHENPINLELKETIKQKQQSNQMRIKISEIQVGIRERKNFNNIEELAASIARHGQIEPIIIDENNKLIAGERRLRACQLLKQETIEVKLVSNLTEIEKKEIELEENIQREQFTWQEEVEAKQQLHKLKQKLHGNAEENKGKDGWTVRDTANALDQSVGIVSSDLQLARGLKAFPELAKEKSKTIAFKKLKQLQERILQEELSKRMKSAGIIDHPSIINGNCIEEMSKMEAESIDLIITDPPYGIDIDNAHTYGRMTNKDTNFDDQEHTTFDLLDKSFREMYRVLKDNRHCYIFFAIDKYEKIVSLLVKHNFEVHQIPLIWDKGSGSYPSQSTSFVHSYEPFLLVTKGKRLLNGTPRDIFQIKRAPSNKKIHPTEKPTELLRDLINLSSLPGEKVLDPFAGSGSTLIAARETSRQAIGIELNPSYYNGIINRLNNQENQEINNEEGASEGTI